MLAAGSVTIMLPPLSTGGGTAKSFSFSLDLTAEKPRLSGIPETLNRTVIGVAVGLIVTIVARPASRNTEG